MPPTPSSVVGPVRATIGAASIAQGVYGSRGNLELLACDAHDGLWVFWFNADNAGDPTQSAEVPPGTWSAGLHLAAGRRYVQAEILQGVLGPDHLEALALTDAGALESWYWSPENGFQLRGTTVSLGVREFTLAQAADGTLTAFVWNDHGNHALVAGPEAYPERSWRSSEPASGVWRPSDDGVARSAIAATGVPARSIAPGTARRCASTRQGGMVEFCWRGLDDGLLRHLAVPLS